MAIDPLDETKTDQGTDLFSRVFWDGVVLKINEILAAIGSASGICELDGDSLVPVERISSKIFSSSITTIADFDGATTAGPHYAESGTTNAPTISSVNWDIFVFRYNDNNLVQLAVARNTNIMYHRSRSGGTWSAWATLWNSDLFQQSSSNGLGVRKLMKNVSGGSIANGASVAAASLEGVLFNNGSTIITGGVFTGTWKNVSGTSVSVNVSAEFVRVT